MRLRTAQHWPSIPPTLLRVGVLTIFTVMLLLCFAEPAFACPNCKESLSQGPNAANLVRGYFWSIMFMMSMPFVILGGVGGYFYWEVCKARTRLSAAIEPSPLAEMKMT